MADPVFMRVRKRLVIAVCLIGLLGGVGWWFVRSEAWQSHLGWRRFMVGQTFNPICLRAGLPGLKTKLAAGEPVTIAFIGGSITQNADQGGYITALQKHLAGMFPSAGKILIVNAGLAGTDSAWGAKRIDRDVLEFHPDLVFVEFAVNDIGRESRGDMERIVRKIHTADPQTEIMFVYAMSDSAFRKLSRGQLPSAIAEHDSVAKHYRLPSVILGSDLSAHIRSGEWTWKDFSEDACHPTPAGYESYNRDFISAVDEALKISARNPGRFPDPLSLNFQLRPPKVHTAPVAAEATPADAGDRRLEWREKMPTPGFEWIDSEVLHGPSGSMWSLEYAVFETMQGEDEATHGAVDWRPARWFEEGGGFTGERSRILAAAGPSGLAELRIVPYLTGGSVETPRVVWTTKKEGDHMLEVSVDEVAGHVNGPAAMAGLEVVVRREGGNTEKLASTTGRVGGSLVLRQSIWLRAGDSIVVRPFGRGFEFVTFGGFNMMVGSDADGGMSR